MWLWGEDCGGRGFVWGIKPKARHFYRRQRHRLNIFCVGSKGIDSGIFGEEWTRLGIGVLVATTVSASKVLASTRRGGGVRWCFLRTTRQHSCK